jgi:hypothetical protein
MLRRFIASAGLAAALAATILVMPQQAAAHETDPLHRHGWQYLFNPPTECVSSVYPGTTGLVRFSIPDFMTTPTPDGRVRNVYFQAVLEYYDFTRRQWAATYWDGSRWAMLGLLNWQYTPAYSGGLVSGFWRDLTTNRPTPVKVAFAALPGLYYRVHVYYAWAVDGHHDDEVTNYCQVD